VIRIQPDRLNRIQTADRHQAICEDESLIKRELILFFTVTYTIAWIFFGLLGLSRAGLGWLPFELSLPVMTVAGSFAPSLGALITLRITQHRWPTPTTWTLKAALVSAIVSPLLIVTTFVVIPALVLTAGPWSALRWSSLLSPSVFSISTLLGGPLGEEPGWRGFALPRLQVRLGPFRASLLLGVLWATWHVPLFLTKSWSSSNFPTYTLIVTGLSFAMTFLFNLSGGSVVTAIATHAFFNTVSRWLGGLLAGITIRDKPSPELVLGLAGWGIALLILVATRGRLAYRSEMYMNPVNKHR
jgi:membrane protease YdiL (CAAX protease family)